MDWTAAYWNVGLRILQDRDIAYDEICERIPGGSPSQNIGVPTGQLIADTGLNAMRMAIRVGIRLDL